MKQNTPLRLLAVAAATALIFTACGGDDDNNTSGGNFPRNPDGSPAYPTIPGHPGGNPYWYNPTPTPTDTSTTDTPTPPTPPTNTDTGTTDTGSSDTSSTDTTDTDTCSATDTDTACAPTKADADKAYLPMEYAGADKYDEVTITLTPAKQRDKIQVSLDTATTATTATGVTLTGANVGAAAPTASNGTLTVKVSVPDGNADPLDPKKVTLKVTDQGTNPPTEITVGPNPMVVCDEVTPEKACAPTKATTTDKVTSGVTLNPVYIKLEPLAAARGRVGVKISTPTAGVTINPAHTPQDCDLMGQLYVEVDVDASVPSGSQIILTLIDDSGHKIADVPVDVV